MAFHHGASTTTRAVSACFVLALVAPGCGSKADTRSVRARAASSESSSAANGETPVKAATLLFTTSDDLDRRSQIVEDVNGSRAAFRAVLQKIPSRTKWQAPKVDITLQQGDLALINVQLRAAPIDGSSSTSSSNAPPGLESIAASLRSLNLTDLVFARDGDAWKLSAYSACFVRESSLAAAVVQGPKCTSQPLPPSIVAPQTPTETEHLADTVYLTYANAGGVAWAMQCEGCGGAGPDAPPPRTSIAMWDHAGNKKPAATVTGRVRILDDVQYDAIAIVTSGNMHGSGSRVEILYLDSRTGTVTSRESVAPTENDFGIVSIDRARHTLYRIESRPETLKRVLGKPELGPQATSMQYDLVERKIGDASEVRRWTLGVHVHTGQRGDYASFSVTIVDARASVGYSIDLWVLDLGDEHSTREASPKVSSSEQAFSRGECFGADGYFRLVEIVADQAGALPRLRIEQYDTETLKLQRSVDAAGTSIACGTNSIWLVDGAPSGSTFELSDPITLKGTGPALVLAGFSRSNLEKRATINSVYTENTRSGDLVVVGDEPGFVRGGVLTLFSGERDFSSSE